jgi:hypothetical protein
MRRQTGFYKLSVKRYKETQRHAKNFDQTPSSSSKAVISADRIDPS